MNQITKKENCCGCTACVSVCPKKAISMRPDVLGFLYPEIDQSKCIDCGLCIATCDFDKRIKNPFEQNDDALVYVVRHKNTEELSSSQSGAATIAIGDWILNNNGVIYGAGFGEHFSVRHKRASTKEECNEFKKSKYVQSDMNTCFCDAINDLKKGLYVLFTGTGCQIAGFLSLVKAKNVDTSKLLTCDLICHGVPSPRLWQDYVNYIETKKLKKPIIKIDFRDKRHYGWKSHKETFYTTYTTYTTYTYIFYDHVAFRLSCASCPYASTTRLADFTVCDAWGYEKFAPEMGSDNKGLSLMFVSTNKAKKIFSEIKVNMFYKKVNVLDCLQPNMQHPTMANINRIQFEKDYEKRGFECIMKKYGREKFIRRCINLVKRCVRKLLTDKGVAIVKKILGR